MPIITDDMTHVINISGIRQVLCRPPTDDVPIEPGDVVHIDSIPGFRGMLAKWRNPVAFIKYDGVLGVGQYLVYAGPHGVRGYKYPGPGPFLSDEREEREIAAAYLPQKMQVALAPKRTKDASVEKVQK